MALEDIINVRTDINVATVSEAGFSVPLIFAHHTAFADLVREYSMATFKVDMLTDGIPSTHAAYQCALAMSKQQPVGTTFKVGKRSTADQQVVHLKPTLQPPLDGPNGGVYTLTLRSPAGIEYPVTFPSGAADTLAQVCTAIAAAINAATGLTLASDTATYVEHIAPPDEQWGLYNLSANLALTDVSTEAGTLGDDLTALQAFDDDWYGVALPTSSPATIKAVADWVETTTSTKSRKVMLASTHDQSVFDAVATTSPFQYVADLNYLRTHVSYNSRATSFYGAGWLAQGISYEPGTYDWMFKTIAGAVADKLTAAQESRLELYNGTYYQDIYRGKTITGAAQGGSGIFLDLIQLSDWAHARAVEAILTVLTMAPKVGHTDKAAGNAIWGAYKSVIDRAIANESADGDPATWAITVPKRSQLSAQDRSLYRWPGTSFSFTPTGALHGVGLVTITLNVA